MVLNKYRGTLLGLCVICLIPVFLWFLAPQIEGRFIDFDHILLSLGQLAGLVGVALFAVSLFLSARFKFFEKYFEGLNMVYDKHGQFGQFALILLMFHPLLLLSKYSSSFSDAVVFLFPGAYWAQNFGILSLWLMIFLIVLTLYLRPKYNIWKWTHKFLGFAFFLGSLHVWFISSDISRFLPLRIYILSLAGFGLLSFSYRTLFGKFLVSRFNYEITGIRKLNGLVVEISLKALKSSLNFIAGQFVFVQFPGSGLGSESHPFSIVASPDENILKFAVKNLGDYTANMEDLKIGQFALIEGPFGAFSYRSGSYKKQIWVAGGVGVTPFISMAKSFLSAEGYKVDFFYCVRNFSEAIYVRELQKIALDSGGSFTLHFFLSDTQGRISSDYIKSAAGGGFENSDIFVCAPLPMISSLVDQFTNDGVSRRNIHSEEFNF